MLPVVALVGRPNVGKSTLFNALTRSREALVADYAGLTRDRRYGVAQLPSVSVIVVDTGGLASDMDGIDALTAQQSRLAIEEADLVAFMVDARAGLTADDEDIAAELRRTGKPVVLVANKIDGLDVDSGLAEFASLGFGDTVATSAEHRRGLGQLSDRLAANLPERVSAEASPDPEGTRIAIVGRPNVGKSTLINRLLGEERVLAFDQPGTTRDSIYVPWERDGESFVLIDTAGVRRRSKVRETVEKFSVIKALKAIEDCHLAIMVLDAREGVVDQDSTLLGQVVDLAKPLVVALNKWDGLSGEERQHARNSLDRKLVFVPFAERVEISALHGSGFGRLLECVDRAIEASRLEASSGELTRMLLAAQERHQPPMVQGRTAKLRYAHLGGHDPLRIVLHGTRVKTLPASYLRYLENHFRRELDLIGVPLRLELRAGENPYAGKKNVLTQRQIAKRKRLKKFTKRKR